MAQGDQNLLVESENGFKRLKIAFEDQNSLLETENG